MVRLMTSLAAANNGDDNIGKWAASHGIGGVVVIFIAGGVLWALFAAIGGRRKKK